MKSDSKQYKIRSIKSYNEFNSLVEMQLRIGKLPALETLPVKTFRRAVEHGGAVIGIFDNQDISHGFAFHIPGSRFGKLVVWTYFFLIDEKIKNIDLELKLKIAQREHAIERGIYTMCWSIDPFDSCSAKRDFNMLSALGLEYNRRVTIHDNGYYLPDLSMESLILHWDLSKERAGNELQESFNHPDTSFIDERSIITNIDGKNSLVIPPAPKMDLSKEILFFPFPADFKGMISERQDSCERWYKIARRILNHYFSKNYGIIGLISKFQQKKDFNCYVLEKLS